MLAPIPEYIPKMSPQQIVWLEVYKIVIAKKGTTDDDASWAALRAEKAFTNLFGGVDK